MSAPVDAAVGYRAQLRVAIAELNVSSEMKNKLRRELLGAFDNNQLKLNKE